MQKRWYLYTYLSTDIFDGFIYKKRVILIPGSVKKQLGSGLRFLAGSGFNKYGSKTGLNKILKK